MGWRGGTESSADCGGGGSDVPKAKGSCGGSCRSLINGTPSPAIGARWRGGVTLGLRSCGGNRGMPPTTSLPVEVRFFFLDVTRLSTRIAGGFLPNADIAKFWCVGKSREARGLLLVAR